jgi:hypothetical protein
MEKEAELIFGIFFMALLLIFSLYYFKDQIFALMTGAQGYLSPEPKENVTEVIESRYSSLGISSFDSPESKIYKLFKNFDPLFLNEKSTISPNEALIFTPFILNLGAKNYDMLYGNLTNMTIKGVQDFNVSDESYQIGTDWQQPMNCTNPAYEDAINYDNDCWDSNMENNLASFNPINLFETECKIFVHGNLANKFDGKVKIRVGWLETPLTSLNTERKIIYVLVTICDYEGMIV